MEAWRSGIRFSIWGPVRCALWPAQALRTRCAVALDACSETDIEFLLRARPASLVGAARAFSPESCAPTRPSPSSSGRRSCRSGKRSTRCRPVSATTPTFTPPSIMRPRWAGSSGPTIRCYPTTSGCRSAITGELPPSGSRDRRFARPLGQLKGPDAPVPSLGPTRRLDYELEVGIFIGTGNALGTRVPMESAEDHVFGLCLLNDWSARDIQAWEYQPLGPFLAKNFATTISPWIVTLEALAPFRAPWTRPAEDPQPLPYLDSPDLRASGAIDVNLEVWLETERMRAMGQEPERLSQSSFRESYWTLAQLVAHHTVNGCNLEAGDLLGSGTQSGSGPGEAGSLLELSAGGQRPITLQSGETRTFLADGDRVIFRGRCAAHRLCADRIRRGGGNGHSAGVTDAPRIRGVRRRPIERRKTARNVRRRRRTAHCHRLRIQDRNIIRIGDRRGDLLRRHDVRTSGTSSRGHGVEAA